MLSAKERPRSEIGAELSYSAPVLVTNASAHGDGITQPVGAMGNHNSAVSALIIKMVRMVIDFDATGARLDLAPLAHFAH